MNRAGHDVGDDTRDQVLEVLGQTTVAAQVGRMSARLPTGEAGRRSRPGRQQPARWSLPAEGGFDPVLECTLIGAVRPELFDAGKLLVGADKLPATIRLYDCRHTAASLLYAQGVPELQISAILGHTDPAFTRRTYTHLFPEMRRSAAESIESVVGRLCSRAYCGDWPQ